MSDQIHEQEHRVRGSRRHRGPHPGPRTGLAANIGLTVLAPGEFSLILATLAVAAGLDGRLGPFTAGYVLVLTVAGPVAASRSHLLARRLPAACSRLLRSPRKVSP